ncbi:armadillo-type protein [Pavlovales sp. CCMP2436]|nr:armadillo-type protein [Pavlovales sp. CCMP2436]
MFCRLPRRWRVREGTVSGRVNAATLLKNLAKENLAKEESIRANIAIAGAFPALAMLAASESKSCQEAAVDALAWLCSDGGLAEGAASAGVIPPLVAIIATTSAAASKVKASAATALCHLCCHAKLRQCIVAAGALAPLVHVLASDFQRGKASDVAKPYPLILFLSLSLSLSAACPSLSEDPQLRAPIANTENALFVLLDLLEPVRKTSGKHSWMECQAPRALATVALLAQSQPVRAQLANAGAITPLVECLQLHSDADGCRGHAAAALGYIAQELELRAAVNSSARAALSALVSDGNADPAARARAGLALQQLQAF